MKCNICCGNIDKKYMVNVDTGEEVMYWSEGHNAEPLEEGRCCDGCNNYVVGFRMFLMGANDLSHANIELKRLAYLRMASEGEEE
tara:strand:+ start:326 stop:580 length:255 start_codon:yes stop_codon:yes gene_type:complete